MSYPVVIIGAGPCGLMAAEVLATAGRQVVIYDQMPNPARKFLIAGRGGLNLTHSEPLDLFITRYGVAADWLAPYIRHFTPEMLRQWCESLGEETFVGSSGRVFPRSMKAVPLLRAWIARLESHGVRYRPLHCWQGWDGDALRFRDAAGAELRVQASAVLLALGGASWPRLGSDGGWTALLEQAGVALAPLRPSNCGFVAPWSAHFSERFAGQPLKTLAVTHADVTRQGEAMLTARGIEGGVIYALSSAIREAIVRHGQTHIMLDLRPGIAHAVLAAKLQKIRGNKSLSNLLRSAGFEPVVSGLLREAITAEQLSRASMTDVATWLKALPVQLTDTAGIDRAISSAGGICRDALTEHLMLRAKPGVFAAGEMLDWEAPTGGYLLQACFSTAVVAAKGILRSG